jgi:hypothetical protein
MFEMLVRSALGVPCAFCSKNYIQQATDGLDGMRGVIQRSVFGFLVEFLEAAFAPKTAFKKHIWGWAFGGSLGWAKNEFGEVCGES